MIYRIEPVPAPRMTRSDRWKKRTCVLKYFAFRAEVKLKNVILPDQGVHVIFHMPMPKSWSAKKKREMCGAAHQQRPDVDNLFKALADSVYDEDSHIFDVRISKFWCNPPGCIEIKPINEKVNL